MTTTDHHLAAADVQVKGTTLAVSTAQAHALIAIAKELKRFNDRQEKN